MTAFQRTPSWLLLAAALSVTAACTQHASSNSEAPVEAPSPPAGARTGRPPPEASEPPLSNELKLLKRAVDTRDPAALQRLLSPSGVLCGDYLYGPSEYEILVQRPDGGLRSWVFGSDKGKNRSLRTYLELGNPIVSTQSATHRSADLSYDGWSLHIGFSLADGRWVVSEGLFCE